jgi:integrase
MASIDKVAKGYRARWRAPDGASRSKTFTRKVDAERWLTTVEHSKLTGSYLDPAAQKITFAEYVQSWAPAQSWRSSTRKTMTSRLNANILPALGARSLSSLRRSDIQGWVAQMAEKLAPRTVNENFHLLSAVLRSAQHDRLIAVTPCDGVRLPRREGSSREPLTVAQVEALSLEIVPPLRSAVLFAALTGLRQGELFGLTSDRIRWLRRELVVDRQLVDLPAGALQFGPLKTARSLRTVPLADRALEVLSEHLGTYPPMNGLIFHREGRPWRRVTASVAMRRATNLAGLPAGWHALRHHCASVLIAQGLGVTAVAAVLGHSPGECLRTYANWWPSENDAIRVALERAWSEAGVSGLCHEAGSP